MLQGVTWQVSPRPEYCFYQLNWKSVPVLCSPGQLEGETAAGQVGARQENILLHLLLLLLHLLPAQSSHTEEEVPARLCRPRED